jgi:HEAT repeat protein
MVELRKELEGALESDDLGPLERIIERGDPDDFETLQELVQDEDTSETYRRRAMTALGKWPDREDEAVEVIEFVLPGLSEIERITAVSALGRVGTPAARDVLLECRDDVPDVRRQAVKALGRIRDETAETAIREMAEEDTSEMVRETALKQIQRMDER